MLGIFYILTVLAMVVTFILVKKNDKKVNLISWCIFSGIAYLGFNITVCMIFGVLNIKTDLIFLSVADLIMTAVFGLKIYKDKGIQSFEIRKRDFLAIIICLGIIGYIGKNQYRPLDTTVGNASVDVSMHYSAATNFADNMKVLSKIDNKTGYNFTTMQTGAYINTGIFMNIMRNLKPDYKEYATFKIFEMAVMLLNTAGFYMLISDKLKSKTNYAIGIVFLTLYAFAYPYTSLLYGFSYLSVAIAFATGMFYLAKIYNSGIYNRFLIPLIVLTGVGIIFSYCLFVPAMYAFICIYAFIKDFEKKEEKTYLKIFRKNSLIITGLLLIVTVLSICYLVIPTFTLSDQNKLTDAIGFDGGIYKSLYQDFIFYIPFIMLFIYRSIKNKKVDYKLVAGSLLLFQTILEFIGFIIGFVSPYYYYKIYYILWIIAVEIAVEMMCELDDNKELKFMAITSLVVWVMIVLGAVSLIEDRFQRKYPGLIELRKMESLAGIYYESNVTAVQNIKHSCLVDTNRLKLAEEMGKIEGMTLKNMLVGGMNTNCKAWMYVISRIECGGESINDLQKADVNTTVEMWLTNPEKEYFVLYTGEAYSTTEDYELLFQNEAGVILKRK